MKRCSKCLKNQEITEFYRHPKMADGHLGKCKTCTKSDVARNRSDNAEYYREYDKMRFQRDPWRAEKNKKYAKTEEGRQSLALSRLKWISANPAKRAAHVILGNAVRDRRIEKPETCSRCGKKPKRRFLHAHHHDYTLPLEVEWICIWCHAKEHFPNEYREIVKI